MGWVSSATTLISIGEQWIRSWKRSAAVIISAPIVCIRDVVVKKLVSMALINVSVAELFDIEVSTLLLGPTILNIQTALVFWGEQNLIFVEIN